MCLRLLTTYGYCTMDRIRKNSFSGTAILLMFFLTVSQVAMAEEAVHLPWRQWKEFPGLMVIRL